LKILQYMCNLVPLNIKNKNEGNHYINFIGDFINDNLKFKMNIDKDGNCIVKFK
jgi:hypothetical protein